MNTKSLLVLGSFAIGSASVYGQIGNFDSMNSYAAPMEMRLAEVATLPRILQNEDGNPSRLAFDYSHTRMDMDQEARRFERDFSWDSYHLSYSYTTGSWMFGVIGSYQTADIDSDEINPNVPAPATGRIDSEGAMGALFVKYEGDAYSIFVMGGAGKADNEMDRSSDLGPTFGHSFSRFDTHSNFFLARAQYDFTTGETFVISPYLTFGYTQVDGDGFTEEGGPDRRIVEDFEDEQNFFELGVLLDTGSEWYQPTLRLAYWHDLTQDEVELAVSAANGVFLGTLEVPDPAQSFFIAGLSFEGQLTDLWKARLTLDYVSGDEAESLTVGAGMGFTF
jgi:outer membrane autotransporter protein